MDLKHWFNSQSDAVKIAIITVIGGGIVTGAVTIATTELGKAPAASTPVPTASATAPGPTASICQDKLTLTDPPEDSSFTSGSEKTLYVTGTACGLGSATGWLFDYDSEDHYYYDDYNGNAPAATVQAGQTGSWKYPDVGIGDSGDQNKLYTVTLVLASPSCAQRLRAAPPIDGDYKWKTFPSNCTVVAKHDVYVTYP